jgi:peptide/nickel transport system substrate-binding protein
VRTLPRILPILVALSLLASCGSDGGETERAEDAPTTSRGPATSNGDGADGGDEPPPADEVLRLGLAGPMSLDPAAISPASVSSMILVDLVHDTPTEVGADGQAGPGLATFEPNEDRTLWRFVLGADATFADGSTVSADDVVASIDRIRSQGGGSLAAIQLEDVVAVTAVDPQTVDIGLAAPSAVLPAVLASPLYGIVDPDLLPSAVGSPLNPSGPHRVEVLAPDRLVLERRRGEGPSTIELRLFPDDAAAYDAMSAGELDWSPVPVDRLGDAGNAFGLGGLVPFHATVLLGVNPNVEPLARAPLRQAISLAVDRATLTEAVFGPTAQPLPGLVPTGTPGAAEACVGACGPDVARARQLVAEAFPGGEQPPPIRLLTDDSATHTALAGVLRQQLGAIGVELAPESVDATTYDSLLGVGQHQLFVYSTLGVGLTPATHLLAWESTSPDNLAAYGQGLVDEALRAARAEPDPLLRVARWREIEAAILADVPVVPLAQLRTVAVVSGRVRGLGVRADGSIDVSGVDFRDG